jgi:2'-5' RNA ligase
VRTFIAVDFPASMLEKIEDITAFFKSKTPEKALKWVDKDNLHLTLKFLGEINKSQIEQVQTVMAQSLEGYQPVDIEISGLGMYPDKRVPRVIWLGISGGEHLLEFHKTLDQSLARLGIKPEGRPYSPHLTIARVRRGTDKNIAKEIGETLSQFKVEPLGAIHIDRVLLYQSELTPSGPVYTTLYTVHLNQV